MQPRNNRGTTGCVERTKRKRTGLKNAIITCDNSSRSSIEEAFVVWKLFVFSASVPTATSGYFPPKLATNLRFRGSRSCPLFRTSCSCTFRLLPFLILYPFPLQFRFCNLSFFLSVPPIYHSLFYATLIIPWILCYTTVNYRNFFSLLFWRTFCHSEKFALHYFAFIDFERLIILR